MPQRCHPAKQPATRSRWTNSAQRLALELQNDTDLREMLAGNFVPVLVDPFEHPGLVAEWRWASITLTGTSGPPLLIFLTHEGQPFLSYCSMLPEGDPPLPSLASIARATGEAYSSSSDQFVEEARTLRLRVERKTAQTHRSPAELWHAIREDTDERHGGMQENPKHPHPQLLLLLLELSEAGQEQDVEEFIRTTLRHMTKGGIKDQLAAGFHRCARDEHWIVPHFEKLVPLNAQLATVYATAARIFADDSLRAEADGLVSYCLDALENGVDAQGSDTFYYTWTPREIQEHLETEYLQALALHYHITPHPSHHVLYQALQPESMDAYSYEEPEALRHRIEQGKRQLRMARGHRRQPEAIQLMIPSWPAESLRWLFNTAELGCDVPVRELEELRERVIGDQFREQIGYVRAKDGVGTEQAWLEDQAALLASMLACYKATSGERWLERAQRLADIMLSQYADNGEWLDQPRSTQQTRTSWAITDDVLPSAIATTIDALCELGEVLNDPRYPASAKALSRSHLSRAVVCGHRAAALWKACFAGTIASSATR